MRHPRTWSAVARSLTVIASSDCAKHQNSRDSRIRPARAVGSGERRVTRCVERSRACASEYTHANRYPPFELVPTCHVHYVCIRSTSKEEIPFRQERLSSRCFSPAVRCVCILQTLQVCCRLHIGVMLHAALPSSSDAQNACFLCERGPRTVGGGAMHD